VREQPAPIGGTRGKVETVLNAFPWFRRHPHPAIVHFPVGFLVGAPLLETLGQFSNSPRTEWAAYCCLLIAAAATIPSIVTGYFTWWINYELNDSKTIATKRRLAWALFAIAFFAVAVRSFLMENPLDLHAFLVIAYIAILWALAAIAVTIGFLGGKLVFPYDSH